ncbi:hypothetical protein BESB_036070 [Besnoitia besnoiti]|uniref:AP2 domain transcription factor AP2X-6 n=1 Tax=Besnoitia besnoiti TaxID=94643 RepID=A0A2A9MGX1_BESBE|nr:hypothetical protein BESB_036070 [Besnoitia besnoiti]PFH37149.1 hypothetical protein BESB_036070 [Besnoitia besnoiti]
MYLDGLASGGGVQRDNVTELGYRRSRAETSEEFASCGESHAAGRKQQDTISAGAVSSAEKGYSVRYCGSSCSRSTSASASSFDAGRCEDGAATQGKAGSVDLELRHSVGAVAASPPRGASVRALAATIDTKAFPLTEVPSYTSSFDSAADAGRLCAASLDDGVQLPATGARSFALDFAGLRVGVSESAEATAERPRQPAVHLKKGTVSPVSRGSTCSPHRERLPATSQADLGAPCLTQRPPWVKPGASPRDTYAVPSEATELSGGDSQQCESDAISSQPSAPLTGLRGRMRPPRSSPIMSRNPTRALDRDAAEDSQTNGEGPGEGGGGRAKGGGGRQLHETHGQHPWSQLQFLWMSLLTPHPVPPSAWRPHESKSGDVRARASAPGNPGQHFSSSLHDCVYDLAAARIQHFPPLTAPISVPSQLSVENVPSSSCSTEGCVPRTSCKATVAGASVEPSLVDQLTQSSSSSRRHGEESRCSEAEPPSCLPARSPAEALCFKDETKQIKPEQKPCANGRGGGHICTVGPPYSTSSAGDAPRHEVASNVRGSRSSLVADASEAEETRARRLRLQLPVPSAHVGDDPEGGADPAAEPSSASSPPASSAETDSRLWQLGCYSTPCSSRWSKADECLFRVDRSCASILLGSSQEARFLEVGALSPVSQHSLAPGNVFLPWENGDDNGKAAFESCQAGTAGGGVLTGKDGGLDFREKNETACADGHTYAFSSPSCVLREHMLSPTSSPSLGRSGDLGFSRMFSHPSALTPVFDSVCAWSKDASLLGAISCCAPRPESCHSSRVSDAASVSCLRTPDVSSPSLSRWSLNLPSCLGHPTAPRPDSSQKLCSQLRSFGSLSDPEVGVYAIPKLHGGDLHAGERPRPNVGCICPSPPCHFASSPAFASSLAERNPFLPLLSASTSEADFGRPLPPSLVPVTDACAFHLSQKSCCGSTECSAAPSPAVSLPDDSACAAFSLSCNRRGTTTPTSLSAPELGGQVRAAGSCRFSEGALMQWEGEQREEAGRPALSPTRWARSDSAERRTDAERGNALCADVQKLHGHCGQTDDNAEQAVSRRSSRYNDSSSGEELGAESTAGLVLPVAHNSCVRMPCKTEEEHRHSPSPNGARPSEPVAALWERMGYAGVQHNATQHNNDESPPTSARQPRLVAARGPEPKAPLRDPECARGVAHPVESRSDAHAECSAAPKGEGGRPVAAAEEASKTVATHDVAQCCLLPDVRQGDVPHAIAAGEAAMTPVVAGLFCVDGVRRRVSGFCWYYQLALDTETPVLDAVVHGCTRTIDQPAPLGPSTGGWQASSQQDADACVALGTFEAFERNLAVPILSSDDSSEVDGEDYRHNDEAASPDSAKYPSTAEEPVSIDADTEKVAQDSTPAQYEVSKKTSLGTRPTADPLEPAQASNEIVGTNYCGRSHPQLKATSQPRVANKSRQSPASAADHQDAATASAENRCKETYALDPISPPGCVSSSLDDSSNSIRETGLSQGTSPLEVSRPRGNPSPEISRRLESLQHTGHGPTPPAEVDQSSDLSAPALPALNQPGSACINSTQSAARPQSMPGEEFQFEISSRAAPSPVRKTCNSHEEALPFDPLACVTQGDTADVLERCARCVPHSEATESGLLSSPAQAVLEHQLAAAHPEPQRRCGSLQPSRRAEVAEHCGSAERNSFIRGLGASRVPQVGSTIEKDSSPTELARCLRASRTQPAPLPAPYAGSTESLGRPSVAPTSQPRPLSAPAGTLKPPLSAQASRVPAFADPCQRPPSFLAGGDGGQPLAALGSPRPGGRIAEAPWVLNRNPGSRHEATHPWDYSRRPLPATRVRPVRAVYPEGLGHRRHTAELGCAGSSRPSQSAPALCCPPLLMPRSCTPDMQSALSSTAYSASAASAAVPSSACRMSPPRVYHVVMCTRRYWRVEWVSPDTGRRVYKHFGENKYGGGEQAREVAIKFWDEVRRRSVDGVQRGEWAGLQEVTRRVREEGVDRILYEVTSGAGGIETDMSPQNNAPKETASQLSAVVPDNLDCRMPSTVDRERPSGAYESATQIKPVLAAPWGPGPYKAGDKHEGTSIYSQEDTPHRPSCRPPNNSGGSGPSGLLAERTPFEGACQGSAAGPSTVPAGEPSTETAPSPACASLRTETSNCLLSGEDTAGPYGIAREQQHCSESQSRQPSAQRGKRQWEPKLQQEQGDHDVAQSRPAYTGRGLVNAAEVSNACKAEAPFCGQEAAGTKLQSGTAWPQGRTWPSGGSPESERAVHYSLAQSERMHTTADLSATGETGSRCSAPLVRSGGGRTGSDMTRPPAVGSLLPKVEETHSSQQSLNFQVTGFRASMETVPGSPAETATNQDKEARGLNGDHTTSGILSHSKVPVKADSHSVTEESNLDRDHGRKWPLTMSKPGISGRDSTRQKNPSAASPSSLAQEAFSVLTRESSAQRAGTHATSHVDWDVGENDVLNFLNRPPAALRGIPLGTPADKQRTHAQGASDGGPQGSPELALGASGRGAEAAMDRGGEMEAGFGWHDAKSEVKEQPTFCPGQDPESGKPLGGRGHLASRLGGSIENRGGCELSAATEANGIGDVPVESPPPTVSSASRQTEVIPAEPTRRVCAYDVAGDGPRGFFEGEKDWMSPCIQRMSFSPKDEPTAAPSQLDSSTEDAANRSHQLSIPMIRQKEEPRMPAAPSSSAIPSCPFDSMYMPDSGLAVQKNTGKVDSDGVAPVRQRGEASHQTTQGSEFEGCGVGTAMDASTAGTFGLDVPDFPCASDKGEHRPHKIVTDGPEDCAEAATASQQPHTSNIRSYAPAPVSGACEYLFPCPPLRTSDEADACKTPSLPESPLTSFLSTAASNSRATSPGSARRPNHDYSPMDHASRSRRAVTVREHLGQNPLSPDHAFPQLQTAIDTSSKGEKYCQLGAAGSGSSASASIPACTPDIMPAPYDAVLPVGSLSTCGISQQLRDRAGVSHGEVPSLRGSAHDAPTPHNAISGVQPAMCNSDATALQHHHRSASACDGAEPPVTDKTPERLESSPAFARADLGRSFVQPREQVPANPLTGAGLTYSRVIIKNESFPDPQSKICQGGGVQDDASPSSDRNSVGQTALVRDNDLNLNRKTPNESTNASARSLSGLEAAERCLQSSPPVHMKTTIGGAGLDSSRPVSLSPPRHLTQTRLPIAGAAINGSTVQAEAHSAPRATPPGDSDTAISRPSPWPQHLAGPPVTSPRSAVQFLGHGEQGGRKTGQGAGPGHISPKYVLGEDDNAPPSSPAAIKAPANPWSPCLSLPVASCVLQLAQQQSHAQQLFGAGLSPHATVRQGPPPPTTFARQHYPPDSVPKQSNHHTTGAMPFHHYAFSYLRDNGFNKSGTPPASTHAPAGAAKKGHIPMAGLTSLRPLVSTALRQCGPLPSTPKPPFSTTSSSLARNGHSNGTGNIRHSTRTPGRIYSLLVRGVRCWRAEWHEKTSGQRRTRQYAAPKHGEERARAMCLWALCEANCVPAHLIKEAQERFGYDSRNRVGIDTGGANQQVVHLDASKAALNEVGDSDSQKKRKRGGLQGPDIFMKESEELLMSVPGAADPARCAPGNNQGPAQPWAERHGRDHTDCAASGPEKPCAATGAYGGQLNFGRTIQNRTITEGGQVHTPPLSGDRPQPSIRGQPQRLPGGAILEFCQASPLVSGPERRSADLNLVGGSSAFSSPAVLNGPAPAHGHTVHGTQHMPDEESQQLQADTGPDTGFGNPASPSFAENSGLHGELRREFPTVGGILDGPPGEPEIPTERESGNAYTVALESENSTSRDDVYLSAGMKEATPAANKGHDYHAADTSMCDAPVFGERRVSISRDRSCLDGHARSSDGAFPLLEKDRASLQRPSDGAPALDIESRLCRVQPPACLRDNGLVGDQPLKRPRRFGEVMTANVCLQQRLSSGSFTGTARTPLKRLRATCQ